MSQYSAHDLFFGSRSPQDQIHLSGTPPLPCLATARSLPGATTRRLWMGMNWMNWMTSVMEVAPIYTMAIQKW